MKLFIALIYCAVFYSANGMWLEGIWNYTMESYNKSSVYATVAVQDVLGLIEDIPNLFLSPEEIFFLSQQLTYGYPVEAIFDFLAKLCSISMSHNTINSKITPSSDQMKLTLRTMCANRSVTLSEVEKILDDEDFDASKKVEILVSGWTTNSESTLNYYFSKAFACRGDVNFLTLDTADAIDTVYTWSALNTEVIGQMLAEALSKLKKIIPASNIHLMGHSLGAHIVGATGRYYLQSNGQLLSHITGLDPANPCFNEGQRLTGLYRGNAEFVDVIHTNMGVYGQHGPTGDADFYPAGLGPVQPGCFTLSCSHEIVWRYYAESIYPNNEYNFNSTRCNYFSPFVNDRCHGDETPMGYIVSKNLKGDYYLFVNSHEPYGKNATSQFQSVNSKCGMCD